MLEQNLVQPRLVIERAEGGFQALHRVIPSGMVEAFVIHSANLEHCAEVPGLGQKRVVIPEAVQVDVRLQ